MNAETLIKHMATAEPMPPAIWRVRSKGDGSVGTVVDVLDDGVIVWVGDDRSCHISKPDFLETVS